MERVKVAIQAADPLTLAGLTSCLRARFDVSAATRGHADAAVDVVVLATDRLTPEIVTSMRRSAAEVDVPVVLIVNQISESELITAVECRVVAVLPRGAATPERLAHSVRSAATGGGVMPSHMLGNLLRHVERLRREAALTHEPNESTLTPREIEVLRLIADGWDTSRIAGELCYSERTVKNVIHGVTNRLKLRNRPHAVAYAVRAGMI